MFDKIGRLAEAAAGNVGMSRRGFLDRLGRAALVAAGVVSGLALSPGKAHAGSSCKCCYYADGTLGCTNNSCPKFGYSGAPLVGQGKCAECCGF